jgi:serine protease inhibitor
MKSKYFILPALLLSVLSWQCEPQENMPEATFNCAETPGVCALSDANNQFGTAIFKKLHERAPFDNLFISPTSIATAFAMALQGAEGATASEIMETLELQGFSIQQLNDAYKVMLQTLPALDEEVKLRMANSIWYRQGFAVKPPFLEANTLYYQSEIFSVDFRSPNAIPAINGWVNQKTGGLIPKILDEIPANAVMFLLNAMYFKGDWAHQFKEQLTADAPFYRANNTTSTVKMMQFGERKKFPLYSSESFYAIDLPYGDSVFSMTLLVPRGNNTVSDIIGQLDAGAWQEITSQMQAQEMEFKMPKFKLEWEKKLNVVLQDLGIVEAFIPGVANFSGISNAELYIDEVKHKSFIEVEEKGSRAAAVTSIGIGVTSLPNYPVITLDRPFVFAIRENQAGNILFLGKMMDPVY